MRYCLRSLHPALERCLDERLRGAGHEAVGAEFDALAVGVGALSPGDAVLDISAPAWDDAIARARTALVAVRDTAADLTARDVPGRIVVVVDPTAARVAPGGALSAVPSSFLTTAAQVAAAELAGRGIAVNVLVSGWLAPAPPALAEGTPTRRLADADEVARACAFLLTDAAGITGATLTADGGWSVTKATGGSPLLTI